MESEQPKPPYVGRERDSDWMDEYDETVDENKRLRARLVERDREIEAATAETLRLCRQHAKWIKEKEQRIAELEADLTAIKNPGLQTTRPAPPWPRPCYHCGRSYGAQYGFPDLVVPHDVWKKISPTKDEGGLLCPSCMCRAAYVSGVVCDARFTSGPFAADTEPCKDKRIAELEEAHDALRFEVASLLDLQKVEDATPDRVRAALRVEENFAGKDAFLDKHPEER